MRILLSLLLVGLLLAPQLLPGQVFKGRNLPEYKVLFMGDHGTLDFSRANLDTNQGQSTSLYTFSTSSPAFHMRVDEKPGNIFWTGEERRVLHRSNLCGKQVKSYRIPGFAEPFLDRHNNKLIYTAVQGGQYHIRSLGYKQLKDSAIGTTLVSSSFQITRIVANPNNCNKIFYFEDRRLPQDTSKVLVQYDMQTQLTQDLLNSNDHPFLLSVNVFTIDPDSQMMYWGQNLEGTVDDLIGRANYTDGSGLERWIDNSGPTALASYPLGITIDYQDRRVYWADINMNWYASAKLSGNTMADRDFQVEFQPTGPVLHPTTVEVVRLKAPQKNQLPKCD